MKFVIVCSSRTGSTMLNGGFNNHSKISAFDEAMTPRGVSYENLNPELQGNFDPYIKYQRRWRYIHSLWFWMRYIVKWKIPHRADHLVTPEILKMYFDWMYSRNEHVGFKLLHPHVILLSFCIDVLKDMDVKVIHLIRDPLERIASMRNKFGYTDPDEALLNITDQEKKDIEKWFPERLVVTYEELTNNKEVTSFPKDVVKRMFDYIGIQEEPKLTIWQRKTRK